MPGKKPSTKKTATAAKKPARTVSQQAPRRRPSTLLGFQLDRNTLAIAALVIVITGIVFSGVTRLHWTNWDDDEYVYENDMVMAGDYQSIFKKPVNNNYNPLPVAMMAWEWNQVTPKVNGKVLKDVPLEEKAWLFHFNNLWMHLVCTALVFWLMLQLGLNPLWAGFAALLFGIHPMRVESVAWITERKDVMFGMFFVAALIAYLRFLQTKQWLLYGVCMVLFVLSLLSKIQAVSLPLCMLAMDWYRGRKFSLRLILEKLPFFAGSLVIGYVGVLFLAKGETIDVGQTSGLLDRLALGMTSYCLYIVKAVIPYQTCAFYPYPKDVGILHYLGMVVALAIVAAGILLRKISRETTFGLAFFSVNIVFLLQIVGAGSALLADRFSYIAYIGLFFALAMVAQRIAIVKKPMVPVMAGIAAVMLAGYAYLTTVYIPAWKNSDTLWTDVITKHPRKVVLAYVNRGQYLRRHGRKLAEEGLKEAANRENDRAFEDFNTAIQLQPNYQLSYLNRGNIYFDRGENDKALADYTKVLELLGPIDFNQRIEPSAAGAYSNRGAIYARKGMTSEALADLEMAVKINPKDATTWNNLAIIYFDMGDYPKAIEHFTELLKYEPGSVGTLNARGVCYLRLEKWKESLHDFNAAISLAPKSGAFYENRAIVKSNLGDKVGAMSDIATAQSLGHQIDPEIIQMLQQ